MRINNTECRLRFILFLNSKHHYYTKEEVDFLLKDLEKDADDEDDEDNV